MIVVMFSCPPLLLLDIIPAAISVRYNIAVSVAESHAFFQSS